MKPVRLVPLSRASHTRHQTRHHGPHVQLVPEEVLDHLSSTSCPSPLPSETTPCGETRSQSHTIDLTSTDQPPKHQLVVMGDSISQGFRNFAISDTTWSWPAIVARCAGVPEFSRPNYAIPAQCPGLPFNADAGLRRVFDSDRSGVIDLRAPFEFRSLMDEVEDCWERGDGAGKVSAALASEAGQPHHNLAFFGADLRDALSLNRDALASRIAAHPHQRDNYLRQMPAAGGARSAAIALSGGTTSDSMVDQVEALSRDGGVGSVVVALGGNNVLSSVLSLSVEWSHDDTYRDLDAKESTTVWQPHHFRAEYDDLAARVAACQPERVVLVTVPHVTIIPALRGHGQRSGSSRYFDFYTHPWVDQSSFSERRDRYLTRSHVRVIDQTIELYNAHIRATAKSYGWAVLDLATMLDRLAYRRFVEHPIARPSWWTPYELPAEYAALEVPPDSRFLGVRDSRRSEGGLFGLDGIHPTICASALIAHEMLVLLKQCGAVVAEERPDFAAALAADETVMSPPPRLDLALDLARGTSRLAHMWAEVRRMVRF